MDSISEIISVHWNQVQSNRLSHSDYNEIYYLPATEVKHSSPGIKLLQPSATWQPETHFQQELLD